MRRLLIAIVFVLTACASARPAQNAREIRGVWVATVNNLDWPSRRDLTPDQQRAELVAILDRAQALGLNTIFLQVRPAADAIYPSQLEPWSEFLTGTQGKDPGYDPLAFAVTEAHARGLELHAWFNPFRARHSSQTTAIAETERVRKYGSLMWLDPGDESVRRDTIAVILDVVRRYDVDGVHLDDYFYPYPEDGLDFPDSASWARYRGRMSRADWRRDNVNRFVRELYESVKSVRDVEVGISPFGIWRPRHPRQIRGLDSYADIYADSRLWLQRGWVDYLAPQLYWPIDRRAQSFPALLRWWTKQDRLRRGIVVGISVNRVSASANEIARQLELVRRQRGARGFILFSAHTLMEDRGGVNGVVSVSGVR
jgi:uncharacterized lipoprotein YddW (UPF0748 family)